MAMLLQTSGEGVAGTSASWGDLLLFVVLISPCALPVLLLAALCLATLVRQVRTDQAYDAERDRKD